MTTKRTPAVGDTIEVLDGQRWTSALVHEVNDEFIHVALGEGLRMQFAIITELPVWRWPGEAVDGTRRGRPRLPVAEKRRAVSLWLSPDERAELEAYAAREESMLGEAIRDAALRAARWKP